MSVSITCVYWLTKSTDSPPQDYLIGGNDHFEVWDLDPLCHLALPIDSPTHLGFLHLVWPLIHPVVTTILSVWSPIFTWVCPLRGSQVLRACSWWWPPPPPRPPASQVWKRTMFQSSNCIYLVLCRCRRLCQPSILPCFLFSRELSLFEVVSCVSYLYSPPEPISRPPPWT